MLVGLIVLATAGFVVGTSIERSKAHHESAGTHRAESGPASTTTQAEGGGGSAETHATESGIAPESAGTEANVSERHPELKPLGVNIEAVPFVVLAAAGSLALALAAWFRPRRALLLLGITVAMLVFALLDVREVFHQSDESRTGLAILAGAIAALHVTAAAIAALMAHRARGTSAPGASAGILPA